MATVMTISTPDGPFTVVSDAGEVLASGWSDEAAAVVARMGSALRPDSVRTGDHAQVREAVEAFYAGSVGEAMAVPVRQPGTPGQVAGWQALRAVAPGEPITYTELAARAGYPRAVRAAASVCARNAAALFVPCHRVVRTGGGLGGFAWGVSVKQSLLTHEAAVTKRE